jgi:hypothetical protein
VETAGVLVKVGVAAGGVMVPVGVLVEVFVGVLVNDTTATPGDNENSRLHPTMMKAPKTVIPDMTNEILGAFFIRIYHLETTLILLLLFNSQSSQEEIDDIVKKIDGFSGQPHGSQLFKLMNRLSKKPD